MKPCAHLRSFLPLLGLTFALCGCRFGLLSRAPEILSTEERVGAVGPNRYITPANQILTPAGTQVELPGLRPQTLALSPDGKILVTSGKTAELVVIDPGTGKIRQRVTLPSEKDVDPHPEPVSANILEPDKEGQ